MNAHLATRGNRRDKGLVVMGVLTMHVNIPNKVGGLEGSLLQRREEMANATGVTAC
jgi:hypothetical protein